MIGEAAECDSVDPEPTRRAEHDTVRFCLVFWGFFLETSPSGKYMVVGPDAILEILIFSVSCSPLAPSML